MHGRRWAAWVGLLSAAWLAPSPGAEAADIYLGLEAYDNGDYAGAIRELEPLAEAGDLQAQVYLGQIYFDTQREWWDDARAFEWFRRAAAAGQPVAQTNLGLMYELGRGVPVDLARAAEWYRKAADQGRATAQYNLGRLYGEGIGVEADPALAAEWYRRAAGAGNDSAQYELGQMYLAGRGVPEDPKTGARWLRRAAGQGHTGAALALARLYDEGIGVPRSANKALRWRARAAEQGAIVEPPLPSATTAVAAAGAGTEPTRAKSAATEPSPDDAPGVDTSPAEASPDEAIAPPPVDTAAPTGTAPPAAAPSSGGPKLAAALPPAVRERLARAETGDAEAQYELGRLYELGLEGVPASSKAAQRWYESAATAGHGLAAYRLAFIYLRGRGISSRRDYVQAYYWFDAAARGGVGDAERWQAEILPEMSRRELREVSRLLGRPVE